MDCVNVCSIDQQTYSASSPLLQKVALAIPLSASRSVGYSTDEQSVRSRESIISDNDRDEGRVELGLSLRHTRPQCHVRWCFPVFSLKFTSSQHGGLWCLLRFLHWLRFSQLPGPDRGSGDEALRVPCVLFVSLVIAWRAVAVL